MDSQKAKRSQFTLYTIAYIAFLLLGLIAILWWLRRLYVSLDRRVAERTRELSVAYDDLKTSQLRLVQFEKMAVLGQMIAGIDQIAELVTDLKNFARLDESNIQKVNIKTCIDTSLNIAKNNIKQYNIVKNYQNVDLPKVECSPSQINQVLLNLLNNAAHAVDLEKGAIGISAGVSDNYVYVQIIDKDKSSVS